jgi:hypothetical protein
MKYKLCLFLTVCLLTGCGNTLLDDVYKHTNSSDNKEMYTAFIILSNLELNDAYIDKIEQDYTVENNLVKKYLFEFVLAKRTQEEKNILKFIDNTKNHSSLLIGNYSGWVSIGSPFLELISIYSTTNDEALGALLLLVLKADGAVQEVIASDLRRVYKIDPVRFSIITKKMDLNLEEILVLMEVE